MPTVSKVGEYFFKGKSLKGGTRGNIVSLKVKNKVYLIGYGWAIYGINDLATGDIIYYSKWWGYSPTTSKHLSQTGIARKYTILDSKIRPTTSDYGLPEMPSGGYSRY